MLLLSSSTMVPNRAFAVAPDLGTAESFVILAGSVINNGVHDQLVTGNTGHVSTLTDTFTYVTGSDFEGAGPLGTITEIGTPLGDQHAVYASIGTVGTTGSTAVSTSGLDCTFAFANGAIDLAADTTHGSIGVYTPGVYCINGAVEIGTAGITLDGTGTYIFKSNGRLTSVSGSFVALTGGADDNSVFWVPSDAVLGENSQFTGTILSGAGAITLGNNSNLTKGRLLSESAVTINIGTHTITVPTVDTISPTVFITSSSGSSGSTVGSTTLSYTATFSESVSDFIIGDITVTGTANDNLPTASNFAGSGTTYTFDVLGGSSDGTVLVSVDGSKATDANGNANSASNTYTLTLSTEQETSTGTSESSTIPIISRFNINTDESETISYYFTGSTTMLKATTGEKITLQVTLDDEEASKGIIHFGLYTNIQKLGSDIKNSNAYVIFDMGLPLKVVDTEGIFKDVQLNTSYQGKSMIVDVILTFDKPMKESDIILEVWNQGRHPKYETIPSVLVVTEHYMSGPNISGLVTMPEVISKEPIRIFSTTGGQITEIKNNEVLILKNKDVGMKISGFIEDAVRGDKVNLIILRPDDSVYTIDTYVNSDDSYSVLTKLHTKWASGFYEILVSYNEKEQGKIRVYVTDKELV